MQAPVSASGRNFRSPQLLWPAAGQRVDEGTAGCPTGIAALHGIRQHALQCAKIGNFRPNLRKVTDCKLTCFGAYLVAVPGGEDEQGSDFVKAEPEFAGTSDKGEDARLGHAVGPSSIGGPGRSRNHLDTLVIADGLDIDAGAPGEFADLPGGGLPSGNGVHREFRLIL